MARARRWTEIEAREALRAWRKSGKSIAEFARRRGLVPERLYHWKRKLNFDEDDVEMVAVSVVAAPRPRGEPVLVLLRTGHNAEAGPRLRRGSARARRRGARRMLTIPSTTRIFMASKPVDMRKGFDGLSAIVAEAWKKDPHSGALFVFVGKRRDRVKVLYWDRNGFVLHYKRLEKGRLQMPNTRGERVKLQAAELAMLLGGIDLNAKRLPAWDPPESSIDKDH